MTSARALALLMSVFLALHALIILDASATFAHVADPETPLRVSAEVGVVSFGHWAWLWLPWVLNSTLVIGNGVLSRISSQPNVSQALTGLSAAVSFLFLLGALATVRAGLVSLGGV